MRDIPFGGPSFVVTNVTVNCYEVLGVVRGATSDEVRGAFRLRSHMFHPDKYENYAEPLRSQLVVEAAKEFKKLTGAYEVLRDPARRASHDRELDRSERMPAPPRRAPAASEAPRRVRRAPTAAPAEPPAPRERDPQLLVRPERLDFGIVSQGSIGQLTLKVQNLGGRTLFGDVSSDRAWLTLSDRTFISNQVVISVNLDTSGLQAGQAYAARVTIKTLNGGDEVVPVSVRIAAIPDPQLAGVPSLVDFGEAEAGKRQVRTVTLTNAGSGTLIGSIATRVPWLSVSESRFRGNVIPVDLVAETASLAPGEHEGQVHVSSNGGPASITVLVRVAVPVPGENLAPRTINDDAPRAAPSSPAPTAATGATLPRDVQQSLLARIHRLEPMTDWEGDFLDAIARMVRAGQALSSGELAKVFEIEARASGG